MSYDNTITVRTPDKYNILNSLFEKKIRNPEYLELTLKAFELSSSLKEQKLTITESLKTNKNVSLFDHQILAAEKMINEFGCTGLLADEVGLGKTVEAGIIIKELIVTGIAKNTLIFIDDFNVADVENGTRDFLARYPNQFEIIKEIKTAFNMHPTFWNGFILLKKK